MTRLLPDRRSARAALISAGNAAGGAALFVALAFRDTPLWRAHPGAVRIVRVVAAAAALTLLAAYAGPALRAWRAGRLSTGAALMVGIVAVACLAGGWGMLGTPGVSAEVGFDAFVVTAIVLAVAAAWVSRRYFGRPGATEHPHEPAT